MQEQHDEALAADALDPIRSVIQDQPGLPEEALELTAMILEEALNHSQAGREASGE
ncbi:hypothetical protein EDD16DRAFT_1702299 [Pisolithus croceorrhizus]|nr:hypothetical protein EDD16DRAFT_1715908 [Pisolithus croceorrhizus]KAI6158592.1 hypothetical protein EDD17DRAFT_1763724 [Pisolithus thermaeus]KAI6105254.1 hypothetical protein EDD16DRAFT_1714061 [Pisolithus croceorrhizus]KAI6127986.1 hypothetical protein EDD16DRAFT_1702299 [Pisolithus croceorrhizus]KAI6159356.1 hypothetical protein EDD17DRAFT_1762412 [Pisolithus thermaeus]